MTVQKGRMKRGAIFVNTARGGIVEKRPTLADIDVAMGITATEVAKDAANLTLTGIFGRCQAAARASSAVAWSARTA